MEVDEGKQKYIYRTEKWEAIMLGSDKKPAEENLTTEFRG